MKDFICSDLCRSYRTSRVHKFPSKWDHIHRKRRSEDIPTIYPLMEMCAPFFFFSCAFNTGRNFYGHSHGNLQRDLFFCSLAPCRSLPRTLKRNFRKTATPPYVTALSHSKRWFIWQRKNTLARFIHRSRKANIGKLRELPPPSCYIFCLFNNKLLSVSLKKFDEKFN